MKQYKGISVDLLHLSLAQRINYLVDTILNYESDTFSSTGSELTTEEAEAIALAFVIEEIERKQNLDTMDGCMITSALKDIR